MHRKWHANLPRTARARKCLLRSPAAIEAASARLRSGRRLELAPDLTLLIADSVEEESPA